MNTDVEDLLRDGMERFTGEVRAPAGLARAAGRLHRRRRAARAAMVSATAAVTAAAAVIAATGIAGGTPAPAGPSAAQARTVAYVTSRVKQALASENLVYAARSHNTVGEKNAGESTITLATWAYGSRGRFEEFAGSRWCPPRGGCTHRGGSGLYLASGTALVGGKLTGVYVTYYNRKWSVLPSSKPDRACSRTAALESFGPSVPASRWPAFIGATLACGAGSVTGHVRVDGVEATKITGKPVTIKLPAGEARAEGEKWATSRWTWYVNSTTYLPVRMDSWSSTYGGRWPASTASSVTDVQWLPPTAANIAKAMVTIPAGFRQVSSPADQ
jgi:hypothetical protein